VANRKQRLIEAAKNTPLPEGTYAIGGGLIVVGLSAYGFQILAARGLSDTGYAALNSLWALVFVVAPGFFQPLEQEVSRALAHRRAQGIGGGPLIKRAALLGGILAGSVALISVIASPRLIENLFHDETGLLLALLIGIASYYLAHTTRGTLSGQGRFGPYGMMHASEGIIRITICVALFIAGVEQPFWYGLALVLPPLGAIDIALRGQRGLVEPGPEAPYSELSTALGWLLLGSVLAQLLGYASFLAANALAEGQAQEDLVAKFITGMFIARIPILLFQAVQAALLPKLAGLAGEGRHADFASGMRKLVAIVIGLGVIGVVAAATIGPFVGKLLFGEDKFILGNRDLALLAAGSGFFILALTLAQGLIALRGYAGAALAWLAGIIAFAAITAAGNDLFLRVELGFVAGSATATAVMGILLLMRMRGGVPVGAVDELVDNVGHEPLEI
jgi:O-antigen/teichoic acid export membrane protein